MDELLVEYSQNNFQLNLIENQISQAIADLQKKQEELQDKNNKIKEQIQLAMEKNEVKKYENDFISITYVNSSTRTTIDSKLLKEKYKDIYDECSKTSETKAYIKINIKYVPKVEENKEENILVI